MSTSVENLLLFKHNKVEKDNYVAGKVSIIGFY